MRLESIELTGFRGFPRRQFFDLNADAVVVIGANGNGKTSLFDGILWALGGTVPRLPTNDAGLLSMYSETGQMRAHLRLVDPENRAALNVTRSFDGVDTRVTVETSTRAYQGASAEAQLIDLVCRDAPSASDPKKAIAGVLTRSIYLQQDVIRHFVEAASDEERFESVSELIGAGRVTELQSSLERAKKAWTTVTHQRQLELRPLRDRLATVEARLSELTIRRSKSSLPVTSEAWTVWWRSLSDAGANSVPVEASSREAPRAIDGAINELNSIRLAAERRLGQLTSLQTELASLGSESVPPLAATNETVAVLKKELDDLSEQVVREQHRLTQLHSQQASLQEKSKQLKALAALALENLGEHCPVCSQTYDRPSTEARLKGLAKGDATEAETSLDSSVLHELLASVEQKNSDLNEAELILKSTQRAATEREARDNAIDLRLNELGIEVIEDNRNRAVSTALSETQATIAHLIELQQIGESMAVRLTHSSGQAQTDELDKEAETLRKETSGLEQEVLARDRTGDLAQRVIEALREASSSVVQERLNEIAPLLQSIYSRVDPHPAFRVVSFLSRIVRGRGHLSTVVSDPVEDKATDLPSAVLSSSQVNALAVSVFLALNIGIPKPPLSVAILDDPLQSLDDINLLGLVDLLRRAKGQRQLLVSTHDRRFVTLLSRKLRPTNESGRTTIIELEGWSRRGPNVRTHDVLSDPVPLRLVAS